MLIGFRSISRSRRRSRTRTTRHRRRTTCTRTAMGPTIEQAARMGRGRIMDIRSSRSINRTSSMIREGRTMTCGEAHAREKTRIQCHCLLFRPHMFLRSTESMGFCPPRQARIGSMTSKVHILPNGMMHDWVSTSHWFRIDC